MLKTRIAVLVSGGGTNLQALIDAQNSGILKSGETVSVRGMGKFTYLGTEHTTKKGRLVAEVKLKGKG